MTRHDDHEESTTSHWNIFGNTSETTIAGDDGSTATGWGWDASQSSDAAHDSYDHR